MDILENNWGSPFEYVVSLFKISCNTNITEKKKLKIIFNTYNSFLKTTQMSVSMRFCLILSF